MSKENSKLRVSALCENIEAEEELNRIIFGFNHQNKEDKVIGTKELNTGLPYELEVLIEANSVSAFIAYINEIAPEVEVQ